MTSYYNEGTSGDSGYYGDRASAKPERMTWKELQKAHNDPGRMGPLLGIGPPERDRPSRRRTSRGLQPEEVRSDYGDGDVESFGQRPEVGGMLGWQGSPTLHSQSNAHVVDDSGNEHFQDRNQGTRAVSYQNPDYPADVSLMQGKIHYRPQQPGNHVARNHDTSRRGRNDYSPEQDGHEAQGRDYSRFAPEEQYLTDPTEGRYPRQSDGYNSRRNGGY